MITIKENANGKLIIVINGMNITRGIQNTDRNCAPLIYLNTDILKRHNISWELTNNTFYNQTGAVAVDGAAVKMINLKLLLEQNRQTGSTTSLTALVEITNGLLVVGNKEIARCIVRKYPNIKDNVITIHDIETNKVRGMHPKQIFFDATAIQFLIKKE